MVTVTGVILVLAANTAFNGFPVLGSILAKDGFAPRALGSRGDRLAYSNGIVFLAVMAIVLILVFDAEDDPAHPALHRRRLRLLQPQPARDDPALDPTPGNRVRPGRSAQDAALSCDQRDRSDLHRRGARDRAGHQVPGGRLDHDLGDDLLLHGDAGIRRHYDNVADELSAVEEDKVLPTRVHAIVLVSKLHKPTLRALAYAKATRPNILEGVYVSTDSEEAGRLLEEWDQRNIDVPLKVLYSPYREVIKPIVDYATEIRQANPRGVVAVYIPEYVVGRWWEQLLHNQTALRLKGGCCSPRESWSPPCPTSSVPPRSRASAASARTVGSGPVTCAEATSRTATRRPRKSGGDQAAPPAAGPDSAARALAGRGAVRGRGRAGGARRALRRPAPRAGVRVVFVRHAIPGSGWSWRSPRAPRATGSGAATPSRCSRRPPSGCSALPVRRARTLCGGCDFQHVALDRPALAQGRGGARAAAPARGARRGGRGRGGAGDVDGTAVAHPAALRGLAEGRLGMRKHRSHEVVAVTAP